LKLRLSSWKLKKDQYKKDISENQRKFEGTIENFQKRSHLEKEKIDISSKNSLSTIEQRYQNQMKEMSENYGKAINELTSKNKELEEEIRNLTLQLDVKNKLREEVNLLTRKLIETSNSLEKSHREIEFFKKDKDLKVLESSSSFEKEREYYKTKILELDKKITEFEGKKGKNYPRLRKGKV